MKYKPKKTRIEKEPYSTTPVTHTQEKKKKSKCDCCSRIVEDLDRCEKGCYRCSDCSKVECADCIHIIIQSNAAPEEFGWIRVGRRLICEDCVMSGYVRFGKIAKICGPDPKLEDNDEVDEYFKECPACMHEDSTENRKLLRCRECRQVLCSKCIKECEDKWYVNDVIGGVFCYGCMHANVSKILKLEKIVYKIK